ncbi:hypothetical protein HDV01_005184 [Terramyces sp. JEL0728]|nr:hypothetical protein HDV01_005184 [Terramyces sp. JEL0728]
MKYAMVVSGPSGSGKSTLLNRLFAKYPDKFGFSVSHCTRQPRPGETPGVSYNYITRQEFEEMIQNQKFIEFADFSGNLYGTSFEAVQKVESQSKICVLDLEVKGVHFIQPPSMTALEDRLKARNTETPDSLAKRLASAQEAFDYAEKSGSYDIKVINEDQDDAYAKFEEYVSKTWGSRY